MPSASFFKSVDDEILVQEYVVNLLLIAGWVSHFLSQLPVVGK